MTYFFLFIEIIFILGITHIWNTHILERVLQMISKFSTSSTSVNVPALLLENSIAVFLKILKIIYWLIAILVIIGLVIG